MPQICSQCQKRKNFPLFPRDKAGKLIKPPICNECIDLVKRKINAYRVSRQKQGYKGAGRVKPIKPVDKPPEPPPV